ncbi:D030070L09Rik protein [Culex quinquefasciatus]|uniref:D030070L09Rik protein n=1 Tax=Culex quinquefasciatus TaxID=7176 RepID=B0W4J6_CULQU|nr:D030070L09Rik protein [Culex quinquefasciatus]|eukprot:XP_001843630.1 D030070L09Rik protein [Culex quinquefasciatus]
MESPAKPIFKRQALAETNPIAGNKKRTWKSLKQILALERTLPWKETDVTYSSINAPPSFVPAKKYSDISGLIAPYTDPHSKLQFHNAEEFQTVRSLPMDLTAGYLALRGATSIV